MDVEFRLPPRMPEDCAALAQDLLGMAAIQNPTIDCLRDPVLIGDLATISTLLPQASPRLIKLLINNTMFHAAQLNTNYAEDIGALLRLHALQTFDPQLYYHTSALAELLEQDHQDDLVAAFTDKLPTLIDIPKRDVLCDFLRHSRSIQPINGDWLTLITVHNRELPGKNRELPQGNPASLQSLQANLESLREALYAIQEGYTNNFDPDGYFKTSVSAQDITLWAALWPLLRALYASHDEPVSRLRFLRFLQQALTRIVSEDSNNEESWHPHIDYACHRLWVSDLEVYQISLATERERLIPLNRTFAKQAFLATQCPPQHIDFVSAVHIIAAIDAEFAPQWHPRMLRRWLEQCPLNDKQSFDIKKQPHSAGLQLLHQCWPRLQTTHPTHDVYAQLHYYFRLLGTFTGVGALIMPQALMQQLWQEGLWCELTKNQHGSQQVLSALSELCPGNSYRVMEAWQYVNNMHNMTEYAVFWKNIIHYKQDYENVAWEMGLLALASLNNNELVDAWLKDSKLIKLSLLTARTLLLSAPFNQTNHYIWATIDDARLEVWFGISEANKNPLYTDLTQALPNLISEERQIDCVKTLDTLHLPLAEQHITNLRLLSKMSLAYRLDMAFPALTNQKQPIDQYNRGLRDLFFLLKDEWFAAPDWLFIDMPELATQAAESLDPPLDIPPNKWAVLREAIILANQDTFISYADFQHNVSRPTAPDEFVDWFYHYVPYLTLGLSSYADGRDRLAWFLKGSPDHSARGSLRDFGYQALSRWRAEPANSLGSKG